MKIKFSLKECGKYEELLYISTETHSVGIPQGCTIATLENALKILKMIEEHKNENKI
jgi:hypothetical protein